MFEHRQIAGQIDHAGSAQSAQYQHGEIQIDPTGPGRTEAQSDKVQRFHGLSPERRLRLL
jgi:hypothetical protein